MARAGGGGGEAERLRLEVHRGGMARLREWNKVQVILEPGSHEVWAGRGGESVCGLLIIIICG